MHAHAHMHKHREAKYTSGGGATVAKEEWEGQATGQMATRRGSPSNRIGGVRRVFEKS